MMKNAITKDMVCAINEEFREMGSVFRIVKTSTESYDISIRKDKFINDDMLNQVYPNKQCREFI